MAKKKDRKNNKLYVIQSEFGTTLYVASASSKRRALKMLELEPEDIEDGSYSIERIKSDMVFVRSTSSAIEVH